MKTLVVVAIVFGIIAANQPAHKRIRVLLAGAAVLLVKLLFDAMQTGTLLRAVGL